MSWDDIGFLISKNRYNENSYISEVYSKSHGKVSGIIFGGTSKKLKNYLQIGNQIHINYNSKSENKIGYFKIEIEKAYSPIFFEDQKKLLCIISAMNLIRILTAESQSNIKIYELIIDFYRLLREENWIKNYIYWEMELFKNLGYDLIFEDLVDKKVINSNIRYIVRSSSEKKIIPNFLVNRNRNHEDLKDLLDGLKLIGDYLEKTILKPNNLNPPITRFNFINSLK
jgi:DNA repair protein RecO (recombination protein O)